MPDLQEILRVIESKRKSSFPWNRQEPYSQPYFAYSAETKKWQSIEPQKNGQTSVNSVESFRVLSWNIDFMLPFTRERMRVALDHLHGLVLEKAEPAVILLNEMLVPDLQLIQAQPWTQQHYHVTDVDNEYWESGHYGTCILIPKILTVTGVFRVHYEATNMERDGLFVDFDVGGKVVTVCTSHLESLVIDPPLRPRQVETVAKYLKREGCLGGVMGGDFNAIQPFDRTLHSDNGLKDAYLELGGQEDSEDGHTWGQMAPVRQREKFGCSRMDKLFFCGGLEVVNFSRFGLGVDVEDKKVKKILMEGEGMDGAWVTDHAGVMATFRVMAPPEGKAEAKM